METFPAYPLSAGSGPDTDTGVDVRQFGDGYVQTVAVPPDNLALTYQVRFTARPLADVNAIETFLRARGGWERFNFTIPGEASARQWRCEAWETERISADVRSLSARLIEVP